MSLRVQKSTPLVSSAIVHSQLHLEVTILRVTLKISLKLLKF